MSLPSTYPCIPSQVKYALVVIIPYAEKIFSQRPSKAQHFIFTRQIYVLCSIQKPNNRSLSLLLILENCFFFYYFTFFHYYCTTYNTDNHETYTIC